MVEAMIQVSFLCGSIPIFIVPLLLNPAMKFTFIVMGNGKYKIQKIIFQIERMIIQSHCFYLFELVR